MSEPGWGCLMGLRGGNVLTQLHVVCTSGWDGQSSDPSSGGHTVATGAPTGQTSGDSKSIWGFRPIMSHDICSFLSSEECLSLQPPLRNRWGTVYSWSVTKLLRMDMWFFKASEWAEICILLLFFLIVGKDSNPVFRSVKLQSMCVCVCLYIMEYHI